jgi:hypothetical protein
LEEFTENLKNKMAIAPKCSKCGEELTDYGAILLSPPDTESRVVKYHVCKKCFGGMSKDFKVT